MTIISEIDIKEVLIGEISEYSPEELADITNQAPLYWTDGYLFTIIAPHAKLFDETLFDKKIMLFTHFMYAKFPIYQAEIKNRSSQSIMILKGNSKPLTEVIQYIKDMK